MCGERMIRVAAVSPLNVRAEEVDLGEWLFAMTDDDYRRVSPRHWAMGTYRRPDGERGAVNVESVGGALLVQHYAEQEARRDYTRYASFTTALLGRFLPLPVWVTWEMSVGGQANQPDTLRCELTLEFSRPAVEVLARLILVGRTLSRHAREETRGFASDIDRKYATVAPNPTRQGLEP